MVPNGRGRPNTTRRRRATAAVLALAMGAAGLSALPAHAADVAGKAETAPADKDPRHVALAQAAASGRPVTVDSLTTADSSTQALPNGEFANTTTLEPTRLRGADGAWKTIDPTLIRNSGGSISTTATPNGLLLSGGGTSPVITATDQYGHSMALSLPVSLPAPTLSGAMATYSDIYPGISLSVTAAPTGGFSEVFEIANAAAEAHAQNLKFTTRLRGLALTEASNGSLNVTDTANGRSVMSAPPAVMWDSSESGKPGLGVSDEFETTTNKTSSAAGPNVHADTGALPIKVTAGTLTLAGSPRGLGASSPTYPVYLDPTWTEPYQSGGTQQYDTFQGAAACQTYTNFDDGSQPGVGSNTIDTPCPGPYEAYYRIDTSNVLNPSYDIKSADLKINELWSSSFSCGESSQTISIYTTSPFDKSTNWTNKGKPGQFIDSEPIKSDGNSNGTMCPGGTVGVDFNVKAGIMQARANNPNWTNWTFMMVGDENINDESLERFNNNPSITTVYDIKPDAPSTPTTWPTPVTGVSSTGLLGISACPTQQSPGYLGIGNINGSDIALLSAKLSSPVASAQMNATFTLKNVTTNTTGTYTSSGWIGSGADATVQTPTLANGDEYSWSAQAYDQFDYSAASSAACYFKVDTTPPSAPTFSNATWPSLSSGASSTVYVGTPGTFTLTASDPISGVAGYYYSFDSSPVPSSGGTYRTGNTVSYTPSSWGAHTLYVQTIDNAGNLSAVSSYSFYVPWNPGTVTVEGAISGGSSPDLITNPSTGTNNGNLVMIPGDASPDATPTVISTPAYSPDETSWTNYLVSHDGSFSNHPGYDDLWAFNKISKSLYIYLNGGTGTTPFESSQHIVNVTKADVDADATGTIACVQTSDNCSAYDDTDWGETSQILVANDLYLGDPKAGVDVSGGTSGLLTVENGTLWYYQGQQGTYYIGNAEELGSSGWDGTTLIGTTTTGTGTSTKTYLLARINTSGNTNGEIMQYPITFDSSGNLSDLGTPTGVTGTALTVPDAPGNTLTSAAYRQLYAFDMHGTGNSDLIAATPSGSVVDWAGVAPGSAGVAQFAAPQSLAAAVSTSTISLPSVGTVYPSGTTWDNGADTLEFAQGQLTVSQDATGKMISQYGQNSPGAYLAVQTDGNVVIYSSGGTALWGLTMGGLNVPIASGDALQLAATSTPLTLVSASGSTLWTAETSIPITSGIVGQGAFTASSGNLAIAIGASTQYTSAQVATGTSPSLAGLAGGAYEVAFQGTNGDLEMYSSASGSATDTGQAMAVGTSPSIASYASGGWAVAFQGSNTDMEVYTSTGTFADSGLGMLPGTSPAVAAAASGGYEVAFQANTALLWVDAYSSLTATGGAVTNTQNGMMKGTNPAISALAGGGYEVAIQANSTDLYLWGVTITNTGLGMAAGTSPSISALANGEWEIAFQANTGILWTYGNAPGDGPTGHAMPAKTSPSIVGTGGENYSVAWQSSNSDFTTLNSGGAAADSGHAMSAGTSPTLTL